MARKKRHLELWLGFLIIIGSVITLIGYFWLTGQPLGERGYHIYMALPDGYGLERGDRVHVSGVEAGVVRSVQLEELDKVVIRLWVARSIQLPDDSRAVLQSVGVFGDQFVLLEPGSSTTMLEDGDTIAAAPAGSLTDVIGDLGHDAEVLMGKLDRLLADPAIDDFHGLLSGLRSAAGEIERLARTNSADLQQLSASLARTASKLEETLEGVDPEKTMGDVERAVATIADAAESMRRTSESLASVAEKIDKGEGTLGRLVNDPSLYDELQKTAESLGSLTRDIQQNPGRYLKLAVF